MNLNARAKQAVDRRFADAEALNVSIERIAGATVIDCGVNAAGGFAAGIALAEVCLADLGRVALVSDGRGGGPVVQVWTDHPIAACLRSQYAGWSLRVGEDFAMASGPMRAAYGREELFDRIGGREQAEHAVGVLETGRPPSAELIVHLAEKLALPAQRLTVLAARTKSLAGTIQVVARSVETALHQLHERDFDVSTIVHGYGEAPLPPPSADDLTALGRTNDAILYGAGVVLWSRAEDDQLAEVAPRVVSSAAEDYGRPFAELFTAAGHDFYRIDPKLFAPAMVTMASIKSGRSFTAGRVADDVLRRSFGTGI